MINSIIERKWNKYIKEDISVKTSLRLFKATFVFTINKTIVDQSVVSNMIRIIPNVTTVSKEIIGKEQKEYFKGFYYIKFGLDSYEDLNTYMDKVLKKELQNIKGLTINSFRGVEQLETKK